MSNQVMQSEARLEEARERSDTIRESAQLPDEYHHFGDDNDDATAAEEKKVEISEANTFPVPTPSEADEEKEVWEKRLSSNPPVPKTEPEAPEQAPVMPSEEEEDRENDVQFDILEQISGSVAVATRRASTGGAISKLSAMDGDNMDPLSSRTNLTKAPSLALTKTSNVDALAQERMAAHAKENVIPCCIEGCRNAGVRGISMKFCEEHYHEFRQQAQDQEEQTDLAQQVALLKRQLKAVGAEPVECVTLEVAREKMQDAVQRLMAGDEMAEKEIEKWVSQHHTSDMSMESITPVSRLVSATVTRHRITRSK